MLMFSSMLSCVGFVLLIATVYDLTVLQGEPRSFFKKTSVKRTDSTAALTEPAEQDEEDYRLRIG